MFHPRKKSESLFFLPEYFTPLTDKKKPNVKLDTLRDRKRSLSKESHIKIKRKSSEHIKTDRVKSYSSIRDL